MWGANQSKIRGEIGGRCTYEDCRKKGDDNNQQRKDGQEPRRGAGDGGDEAQVSDRVILGIQRTCGGLAVRWRLAATDVFPKASSFVGRWCCSG
jgi:hypothetical protein